MEIKVNQNLDKDYYNECYTEWLKFRSVYKRWEYKIGVLSLFGALVIYFIDSKLIYISVGLMIWGILMIYEAYSSKRKWMKNRVDSKVNNNTFTMIFEDNQIQSTGPFTDLKSNWDYFKDAIETEKGIFLIPENGISIYLQIKSFENQDDVKRILRKIKKKIRKVLFNGTKEFKPYHFYGKTNL